MFGLKFSKGRLQAFAFLAFTLISGFPAQASEKRFVVSADIVQIFVEPPKTLVPTLKVNDYGAPGLIYGNVITASPLRGNPDTLELIPPLKSEFSEDSGKLFRYISRKGLVEEVNYRPYEGRFIANNNETDIYLMPSSSSRKVLKIIKGEILKSSGKITINHGSWVRFEVATAFAEGYRGIVDTRIGWAKESDLREVKPDLDQNSLDLAEVPSTSRNSKFSIQISERKGLAMNGLIIRRLSPQSPSYDEIDDMVSLYRQNQGPVFITSDLYAHAFHLLFDRMLQNIEQVKLMRALGEVSAGLLNETIDEYSGAKDPFIRGALARNIWYFGVACRILGCETKPLPPELKGGIESEINSINSAGQMSESRKVAFMPGFLEDYSQYVVRGHYAVNDELKAYFKAMMHFGRKLFLLNDDSSTLSAMYISQLINGKYMGSYGRIRNSIDFLIGRSDDWGPMEYALVMKKMFGGKPLSIADLSKKGNINIFREEVKRNLPLKRIISQKDGVGDANMSREKALQAVSGFKFIGQRYTVDAEIFQRIVSPMVGDNQNPKNLPSGIELMAVLGSKYAEKEIGHIIENVSNYRDSFMSAEKVYAAETVESGGKTAYSKWLYALQSLFGQTGSRQKFCKSIRWGYKNLNTALGSWTELKHDTILYGTQSYAEMGDGGEASPPAGYEPPRVKGYVEPNPEFFGRLAKLVDTVRLSMADNGMLTAEYKSKMDRFYDLTIIAKDISEKENNGKEITATDYTRISSLPNEFDRRLLYPEYLNGGSGARIDPEMMEMAIIADVATDALMNQVLLAGIGYPQETIVLVKDYWGGTRLTRGYIYSYYEFKDGKRWTDKEWREKVYTGTGGIQDKEPSWYRNLY
jgi:hypothetical protein